MRPETKAVLSTLVELGFEDLLLTGLPFSICCLEAEGRGTETELLSLLRHREPRLVERARCRKARRSAAGWDVRDRRSGEPAAILHVSIEEWIGANEVLALYGWEQADLASQSLRVRMRGSAGEWTVVEVLLEMQS